jgi:MFS family permease
VTEKVNIARAAPRIGKETPEDSNFRKLFFLVYIGKRRDRCMLIRQFFSYRYRFLLYLFLITALHTLTFCMAQNPGEFFHVSFSHTFRLALVIVLYGSVVLMSLFNQFFTRKFGMKNLLLGGFLFYFWGLILFFISQFSRGSVMLTDSLLILGMVACGIAFSSVFIALITYIIIEIPRYMGVTITAMFAFANIGVMLASLVTNFFDSWQGEMFFLIFVESLILFSVIYIGEYFVDPPFPKHLVHLRKSTLIWKELHTRFFLFVLLIIFYGICETTMILWGEKFLNFFFDPKVASGLISIFWIFLIVGQFLILVPLYFFAARNVFFFLVFLLILVLISFPVQDDWIGFVSRLALGGIACSACSPILLAMLEEELKEVQKCEHFRLRILPSMELGIAWIIVGYIFGVGIVAFAAETKKELTQAIVEHQFVFAIVCASFMLLIAIYLSYSLHRKKKTKKLVNLDEM